ncbi:MAG TPA: matrixin family metalloprotease, partial [Chromatiaceae bacterium]|nr:matrixin family metalloprotease [Chromatiaceae bacterium]
MSGRVVFYPAILLVALLWSGLSSAYVLMGSKWPEAHTTFYPDLELLGERRSPSGVSWNQAFSEAAEEWSRRTLFRFDIDERNPSHPCAGLLPKYPEDGYRNGAAFTSVICTTDAFGFAETTGFGANTLAVTMIYSVPGQEGITSETDIFFNNTERWDVYDGAERRENDFRRVALHELGHALGLDHETREQAIMAPLIGDLFTLQEDDIRGVAALYGGGELEPIVLHIGYGHIPYQVLFHLDNKKDLGLHTEAISEA